MALEVVKIDSETLPGLADAIRTARMELGEMFPSTMRLKVLGMTNLQVTSGTFSLDSAAQTISIPAVANAEMIVIQPTEGGEQVVLQTNANGSYSCQCVLTELRQGYMSSPDSVFRAVVGVRTTSATLLTTTATIEVQQGALNITTHASYPWMADVEYRWAVYAWPEVAAFDVSATAQDNVMLRIVSNGDGTCRAILEGSGTTANFAEVDPITFAPTILSREWVDYLPMIKQIIVCDGITSIGAGLFADAYNAELLGFENVDGIRHLGDYAFMYCNFKGSYSFQGLEDVQVSSAFYGCARIKSLAYPAGVATSIQGFAFASCLSLETITGLDAVTTINKSAFLRCASIKDIDLPDTVQTVGANAFLWSSVEDVKPYSYIKEVVGDGSATLLRIKADHNVVAISVGGVALSAAEYSVDTSGSTVAITLNTPPAVGATVQVLYTAPGTFGEDSIRALRWPVAHMYGNALNAEFTEQGIAGDKIEEFRAVADMQTKYAGIPYYKSDGLSRDINYGCGALTMYHLWQKKNFEDTPYTSFLPWWNAEVLKLGTADEIEYLEGSYQFNNGATVTVTNDYSAKSAVAARLGWTDDTTLNWVRDGGDIVGQINSVLSSGGQLFTAGDGHGKALIGSADNKLLFVDSMRTSGSKGGLYYLRYIDAFSLESDDAYFVVQEGGDSA